MPDDESASMGPIPGQRQARENVMPRLYPALVIRCYEPDCSWAADCDTIDLANRAMTEHRRACPGPVVALSQSLLQHELINGRNVRITSMTLDGKHVLKTEGEKS